jgi:hypothetical protein
LVMSISVDTASREQLRDMLLSLSPETKPRWGKMNPQQMVEHLVEQIEYSNGNKTTTCDLSPEVAAAEKHKWIYTDAQIPHNLVLKPAPEHYRFADMNAAIEQLMKELETFDRYFAEPDAISIHAGYGAMDHAEWIIWHDKHFTHHFKQFGLIN